MFDVLSYLLRVAEGEGEAKVECVKSVDEPIFRFPIKRGYIKGTETEIRQKLASVILIEGLKAREVAK